MNGEGNSRYVSFNFKMFLFTDYLPIMMPILPMTFFILMALLKFFRSTKFLLLAMLFFLSTRFLLLVTLLLLATLIFL
jgi:hypothetical protein